MRYLHNTLEALAEVYSEKQYFAYSTTFAFVVFSVNVLIGNFKLIASQPSLTLIFDLLLSAHSTMSNASFVFLLIISLLSGIVFSLSLFLVKRQVSYSAGLGFTGIISSILAPACSSCALGLAGIFGISGFLSVLPLKGLELGAIGILLLGISLVYLSGKIVTKMCKL